MSHHRHSRHKNPGASDLITFAILGIGAAAVLKASSSGSTGTTSTTPGTRDATPDELAQLVAAGQAHPTDVIKIQTEVTSAGQPISFVTRNYDPGNPQRDQVIISQDDLARRMGYYIPQVDETYVQQLAQQYSGLPPSQWRQWLQQVATWADNMGPYDSIRMEPLLKLTVKDWDYYRLQAFPGDKPYPEAQAPLGPIGAEEYKNLLLTTPGGVIEGKEVHYKGLNSVPASTMRGLGNYNGPYAWAIR